MTPERSATASLSSRPELIAYRLTPDDGPPIVPARRERAWMDGTTDRFANRCLPLLVANQFGWVLLNVRDFAASWNGGPQAADLSVRFAQTAIRPPVASHFGHGVITWTIPYLFRSTEGYNLLVRGPCNEPKDGIAPLEGIVETDWCTATFTMNWKFTRPGTITFGNGEPFCMIVPFRRGDLASFRTSIRAIENENALHRGFLAWQSSRESFNRGLLQQDRSGGARRWQKHYFRGMSLDGLRATHHETKITLCEFSAPSPRALGDHPGSLSMTTDQTFTAEDVGLLNRLAALHPEFMETASIVKRVVAATKFPINSFDELAQALGGTSATVAFRGRVMTLSEIKALVPAYYFPIGSERDLMAKMRDLQASRAAAAAFPMPAVTAGVDVKSAPAIPLPPDAAPAPNVTSQQIHESTKDQIGNTGIGRHS
jgi:hypothetical protein